MTVCVYGASSKEIDEKYITDGEELGRLLALRGHTLVFGAGNNGLMGAAARGCHSENGRVIGIVPSFFNVDGELYDSCDEIIRTSTMRERKQFMEERSDAFVMTPGGIGTFEEFFEILTLKQLARHNKPIAILNTKGYFNPMLKMLEFAVREKFMTDKCLKLCEFLDSPKAVLDYIEGFEAENYRLSELKNI